MITIKRGAGGMHTSTKFLLGVSVLCLIVIIWPETKLWLLPFAVLSGIFGIYFSGKEEKADH